MHHSDFAGSEWCRAMIFSLRPGSKSCFLISLCASSQRFSGTVADESDTSRAPERRSHCLEALLALHSAFIFLSSPPAFTIPALLVKSKSSQNTSAAQRFLQRLYFLSCCVRICVFVLASVCGCQYSFSDTTRLSGFHMIIHSELFSEVFWCMYAEPTWRRRGNTEETRTKDAVTENLNNRHILYGECQNAFRWIVRRDRCLLSSLFAA